MSAIRQNFVAPPGMRNPSHFQRTIYQVKDGRKNITWIVEYRILPDKNWVNVYTGGSHDEAKSVYSNLHTIKPQIMSGVIANPTHHFPKTKKGRPGKAKYKRQLEEIFPGMRKGRPRLSAYWKADLFSASSFIDSIIGQG